jgi:hypothetical protein
MAIKHNTIILKNYLKVFNEFTASAAIIPGQLVELTSAGKVQKHSGAGKTAIPMFAIEDALQGKAIDEAYAANDTVRVWAPQRGDEVYALLADEESVIIGDFLESNGGGYLRKVVRTNESWESTDSQQAKSQYDKHIVGIALEAKDLTSLATESSSAATATTTQYIKMMVL